MRQPPKIFKEEGTCPNMTLRCAKNAGEGRLFVDAPATIVCVRSGISLRILALSSSLTKYRRISMCRENFRRTGFSLIAMHAKLSSKMSRAVNCWYPKSPSVSRRYIPLPGPSGWLQRIQPLKLREKHYLFGHFSRKSDHPSSSKCSLCETDEYNVASPICINPTP